MTTTPTTEELDRLEGLYNDWYAKADKEFDEPGPNTTELTKREVRLNSAMFANWLKLLAAARALPEALARAERAERELHGATEAVQRRHEEMVGALDRAEAAVARATTAEAALAAERARVVALEEALKRAMLFVPNDDTWHMLFAHDNAGGNEIVSGHEVHLCAAAIRARTTMEDKSNG